MRRPLLSVLSAAAIVVVLPLSAAIAQPEEAGIDVVVVSGPMDHRTVEFVTDAITGTDAGLVILQIDVAVVLGGDLAGLEALIAEPPVPVAVWVGPAPATARGAAVDLVAAAALRGAAPGATIGMAASGSAGDPEDRVCPADAVGFAIYCGGRSDLVEIDAPIPALIDVVEPSIGQFVTSLHGRSVVVEGETVVLDTARVEVVDGVERLVPSRPVRFVSPGVVDRVLHLAVRPEAAFFFLLAGLAFAAFEFYAAGPGLAAAVAAGCLLLAGYGMAVMPMWWPGVAAAVAGIAAYLVDFQRSDLGWKSIAGTALLLYGGLWFTDGAPQLVPVWWVVALVVVGIGLFFAFALTTVVRARFSTQTIGRDHLVGARGVALSAVAPDGEVEVAGARWRARSTRNSGIQPGDGVVVARIDGIVLEVDRS